MRLWCFILLRCLAIIRSCGFYGVLGLGMVFLLGPWCFMLFTYCDGVLMGPWFLMLFRCWSVNNDEVFHVL
jgi:hypothetical protein